jgi:hypothetical protein
MQVKQSSSATAAHSTAVETVTIYRLPNEKLGLGLRFEGGSKASAFVLRLYVQHCSRSCPAGRTRCSWGRLAKGDEIVDIEGRPVNRMTRVECVRALKGENKPIRGREL